MSQNRTYYLDVTREELLDFLDRKGRIAEIGVAEGVFSREILSRCDPSFLALIDPWIWHDDPEYAKDGNNVSDAEQELRFQKIRREFEARALVLRKTSLEAAPDFPDESFDYVYIDAMHTFDAVTADLEAWWPKIKPGGLLMGHDYANHITANRMGFDVVPAVNRFVRESRAAFVGVTNEPYPSYILAKGWHGKANDIHRRSRILCSFDAEAFDWELMPFADGTFKAFPRL
jgi:hypothetical protein